MQSIDLIAMLPELVLLTVACLLLMTVFMNEPQASDEDIFYAPRGTELAYKISLALLLGLSFALLNGSNPVISTFSMRSV